MNDGHSRQHIRLVRVQLAYQRRANLLTHNVAQENLFVVVGHAPQSSDVRRDRRDRYRRRRAVDASHESVDRFGLKRPDRNVSIHLRFQMRKAFAIKRFQYVQAGTVYRRLAFDESHVILFHVQRAAKYDE